MKCDKMRLKISLKSDKSLFIPFNYNHIISSIIYKKIADLEFASELHSSKTFKFFTFSNLNILQRKIVKNGIISKNGSVNFQISSPNKYLIKNLVEGHLDDLTVNFKGKKLFVEKIKLLPEPEFKNPMNVKTISPIIVRTKKEIDGKLKIWDLTPADQQFYTNLENNLIKKYNQFYNKQATNTNNERYNSNNKTRANNEIFNSNDKIYINTKTYKNNNKLNIDKLSIVGNELNINDDKVCISSSMGYVKRKRITLEKDNIKTFHRAFMMDLELNGDLNLIKFAYDCGLGEKNSLGFGMVE
jgi:CRISPR-associated endoribonuclease Cas6